MEENQELPDPIGEAVKKLFGLSYLFPYQRLVVSNILEAAAAAGIALQWPGEAVPENSPAAEAADRESCSPSDQESLGRQIVILPTRAGPPSPPIAAIISGSRR
ncbi:hypothetical protein FACS189461_5140 [Spirochaetia bacterium]|nr:hypothetical protein FACS189461_5140 [Spirochaetia bacterium]